MLRLQTLCCRIFKNVFIVFSVVIQIGSGSCRGLQTEINILSLKTVTVQFYIKKCNHNLNKHLKTSLLGWWHCDDNFLYNPNGRIRGKIVRILADTDIHTDFVMQEHRRKVFPPTSPVLQSSPLPDSSKAPQSLDGTRYSRSISPSADLLPVLRSRHFC